MRRYRDLQKECYEANLLLPRHGLIDLTFGNVSVADRGLGVFAIKPSGVDYRSLKPRDMVVVDLSGKTVAGRLKPSSDTPTHLRLFQAFTQARSVVHTHSRQATAFAQAGRPIPCLGTTHSDYFRGDIPVTRALTPREVAGDYERETGEAIVELFSRRDPAEIPAALVRHHGPFVWGPSGIKAVENALALEIVAGMALQALRLAPRVRAIPSYLRDRHFLRKHGAKSYYGQTASS